MSFIIEDVPQGGGGWFKPKDHADDVAILVEVTAFDRQRPTPNGPKDSALTTMTFFDSERALTEGEPSSIVEGTRVEQTVLARDLQGLVGKATIVTVEQVPSKKAGQHPAWVWRTAPAAVKAQVVAYATKREAERQAAIDAAPDFD